MHRPMNVKYKLLVGMLVTPHIWRILTGIIKIDLKYRVNM